MKFKYLDKVKIHQVFYEGLTGVVVGEEYVAVGYGFGFQYYTIKLDVDGRDIQEVDGHFSMSNINGKGE
jgi:hypothetical protein